MTRINNMKKNTDLYKAMVGAAKAGKIMVMAFGNNHGQFSEKDLVIVSSLTR